MKAFSKFSIIGLVALSAAAAANSQTYVEGTYSQTSVKADGSNAKYKPAALIGTIGYGFHENLAVEGMLGLGIKSSTTIDGSVSVQSKYNSVYGIYVKPRYQVTPDLELFARLGYTKAKIKFTENGGYSETYSEGSSSWGFGASYAIDKNIYVTGSYMNYYKKDGVKIDGINFGLGYKF